MCIRVHSKEVKLKETIRLRGIYTFLSTKERGFELQEIINCGEVTKIKTILVRSVNNSAWCSLLDFDDKNLSSLLGIREHFPQMKFYALLLSR